VVAEIDATQWTLPAIFAWLQREAALPALELARTFNCGIGMVAVVAPEQCDRAMALLRQGGETVWQIGRIRSRRGTEAQSQVVNTDLAWPG
jgi:phosphoribosylformylglycinamidine cyclo-ligase